MPAPGVKPNGQKLKEAQDYLKSARMCLLTWIRENYVGCDNVTENLDTVEELLEYAKRIENMRANLAVKADLLEGRSPFAARAAAGK